MSGPHRPPSPPASSTSPSLPTAKAARPAAGAVAPPVRRWTSSTLPPSSRCPLPSAAAHPPPPPPPPPPRRYLRPTRVRHGRRPPRGHRRRRGLRLLHLHGLGYPRSSR